MWILNLAMIWKPIFRNMAIFEKDKYSTKDK